MITFRPVDPTRWTSRTLNSSSSPNNTDVASDMLVASLLDVVEDQQHVGATSLSTATTRASRHPAQVRRAPIATQRRADNAEQSCRRRRSVPPGEANDQPSG